MKILTNKKLILIVLLLMSLFLVSGCALFNIEMGIDANNTAFLSYHLEIDISQFNALQQHNFKRALYEIAIHFQNNLGFRAILDNDSDPISLRVEKQIRNDSFEQAFESLKGMLTDKNMTVFMMVDMAQISYSMQSGYIINAYTDIQRIIESNDFEDLTQGLQRNFFDSINNSSGSIAISMPADNIVKSSHAAQLSDRQVEMVVPINFFSRTYLGLSAERYIHGRVFDGSIGAIIEQNLSLLFNNPDDTYIDGQFRLRSVAMNIIFIGTVIIIMTIAFVAIVKAVKKRSRYDGVRN